MFILALIHKNYWNREFIKNEVFKQDANYIIEFLLKDLLKFLDLSDNFSNKTKTIEL